ncbi:histone H1A, sperm-like [Diachasmimorpha longicaudata]|uniref:histone H1A, sperm-like n=1 Tax=Diachasmimorpha longicaudata TaxID=58733 RepID=UPI0030B91748
MVRTITIKIRNCTISYHSFESVVKNKDSFFISILRIRHLIYIVKMGDPPSVVAAASKAASKKTSKEPAVKTHPTTAKMVNSAIKTLANRKGSSLVAIKKYIAENYDVDSEKLAPFIKKYLRAAVESETIIQTKGRGAVGSFKLSKNSNQVKPKSKVAKMSPTKANETGGPGKKAASPKKATKTATDDKVAKSKVDRNKNTNPSTTIKTAKKSGTLKTSLPKTPASPRAKKTAQKK